MTATVTPLRRPKKKKSVYSPTYVEDLGPLTSYLPAFAIHLKAKGQAAKTIEKKILAVDQLAQFLGEPDLGAITRTDIERFIDHRLTTRSRSTAATTVIALRAFFGPLKKDGPAFLAVELGAYDSPMEGIRVPAYEEPAIEAAPADVIVGMIAAIEKKRARDFDDIRDLALLRCFIDSGCRLSEITNLELGDVLPMADGRMLLRVHGKGRGGGLRQRDVPIGGKAGVALRRYMRLRADHPRAYDTMRLWLGRRGALKPQGVRRMLERRSLAAGQRIHPHQLRHFWAGQMKADERNRDADIMHLAGWTDPRMLARYAKEQTKQRARENFWAHGAPGDAL